MWTNGREDVCRSEAKRVAESNVKTSKGGDTVKLAETVIRAWAGRRSIASRGPEVERSEGRRVECNARAPAHRGCVVRLGGTGILRRERSEGAQQRDGYGRDLIGAGLRAKRPEFGPRARTRDCGGAALVMAVMWRS